MDEVRPIMFHEPDGGNKEVETNLDLLVSVIVKLKIIARPSKAAEIYCIFASIFKLRPVPRVNTVEQTTANDVVPLQIKSTATFLAF
ncbi:hypothetical protein L2E82_28125 [Cichorium intybus]|uniref:Uncharacterized protein n=1 Tax=Cichorium intybus TaxID=13427 RepID=A0ACB9CV42_CICIN|nr:hypothetical protein L2E82_28125 [Cichorium intybus]